MHNLQLKSLWLSGCLHRLWGNQTPAPSRMLTRQLGRFRKFKSDISLEGSAKSKSKASKSQSNTWASETVSTSGCCDFFSLSSCRTWASLKVVAWATSGSRFKSPTCLAFPWWWPSTSLSEMQLLNFSLKKQACSADQPNITFHSHASRHSFSNVPYNNPPPVIHQDWHSGRDGPCVSTRQRGRGLRCCAVPPLGPGRTRLAGVGPRCERGGQQAQQLPVSLRRSGGNKINDKSSNLSSATNIETSWF